MRTFTVGRSTKYADVGVGDAHTAVSRVHAQISLIDHDTFLVVDQDSANGTEVFEAAGWRQARRANVGADQPLRLGREYETTVRQLLAMAGETDCKPHRPADQQAQDADFRRGGRPQQPARVNMGLERARGPINETGPSSTTAYILNVILPGAGNIYFGQPIVGTILVVGILIGLFLLFFGAAAAMFGIMIILVSAIAAIFTFGLSLLVGLPIGFIFLLMGAGPIVAFVIWIFSLIVSQVLVYHKATRSSESSAVDRRPL